MWPSKATAFSGAGGRPTHVHQSRCLQTQFRRDRGYGQRLHTPARVRRPPETRNISISEDGHIAALDADSNELAAADIPLYTFINPAGLDARGRNLYVPTTASGDALEGVPGENNVGTLSQGFLEMSNVEVVDEMVNMIVGQRAYEMNSKAVQTSDSMLQTAVNLKRS